MDDFFTDLKNHREAAGLTLEAIFERTRIDMAYLKALESGQFDILPEVYIRLFLKKYAQEIGLDPRQVLDRYEAYRTPPKASPKPAFSRPADRSPALGPILITAFALTLAVGIGTLALRPPSGPDQPPPEAGAELAPVPSGTAPEPAVADAPRPEAGLPLPSPDPSLEDQAPAPPEVRSETPPELPDRPRDNGQPPSERVLAAYSLSMELPETGQDSLLTLTGQALETVRAVISADGETVFAGLLAPGRLHRWNARSRFLVEVEKASALALSLQGRPLKPLARSNHKRRLFISRSSIWVEEVGSLPNAVADL